MLVCCLAVDVEIGAVRSPLGMDTARVPSKSVPYEVQVDACSRLAAPMEALVDILNA